MRLVRYLVAVGTIQEVGIDNYVATNTTGNLSISQLAAGVNHLCDTCGGPMMMVLPAFLERMEYRNPTDPKNCPFQDAFRTTSSLFGWFRKDPEKLGHFHLFTTGQREGRANWLDFFPLEEQLTYRIRGGDDAVMLVDVGGALGHEVRATKAKCPNLPGGMILQDLFDTIKQASLVPGMQAMAHDFFTPQPIQGELPSWS